VAATKTKPGGKKPDKLMTDALRVELHEDLKFPDPAGGNKFIRAKKYRLIAKAWANKALKGDMVAIKEINERIEGKMPSPITGTGKDGAIPLDIKNLPTEQLEQLLERIVKHLESEGG
jgi:hypothetical protein